MSTWAVIPAKSFAQAKSRLIHLSASQRAHLAQELFEHVLGCVRAVAEIAELLVLTNGDEVATQARSVGARVLRDEPGEVGAGHLGRVVDAGLRHVAGMGARSAVVLMADLPDLSRADVTGLLEFGRDYALVVAPDRRELGTNALVLSPPDRLGTCFGHPDSLARHLARAERLGVKARVFRSPALGRDVDLPGDLLGELA